MKKVMSLEKLSTVQLKQRIIHLQSEVKECYRKLESYKRDRVINELEALKEENITLKNRYQDLLEKYEEKETVIEKANDEIGVWSEKAAKYKENCDRVSSEFEAMRLLKSAADLELEQVNEAFANEKSQWEQERAELLLNEVNKQEYENEIALLKEELNAMQSYKREADELKEYLRLLEAQKKEEEVPKQQKRSYKNESGQHPQGKSVQPFIPEMNRKEIAKQQKEAQYEQPPTEELLKEMEKDPDVFPFFTTINAPIQMPKIEKPQQKKRLKQEDKDWFKPKANPRKKALEMDEMPRGNEQGDLPDSDDYP
ncbi:hypothetical protein [Alteribacter aurantiacus]|uniref:hypothetical protein n=1 Tax=Alteribacter aurantiacus TaxID=254410 RepID=UPI00041A5059|nr:hypothetical protein [Alteribacter aurantiacus]